ncbi:hypothetical protein F5B20DRAFT_528678 [Whalleya microplaca]|nr:hypothetical protein F5B20DRAFT_528678 [Whalleya microplaca]
MQRRLISRLLQSAALVLLLLCLAHVFTTFYKRNIRWKYTFSCLGLWRENSLSLDLRTARTTPVSVILAATTKDDQYQPREESGLRPGDSQVIYVADDPSAANTTPINKGNEAMVYLTYLIENYDHLPEIMVFMHAHRESWHNNALLARSSALTVNKLQPEYILRQGYVNLACDATIQKHISSAPDAPGLSVLAFTREDWVIAPELLPHRSPETLYKQYLQLWDDLFPSSPEPAPTAITTAKGGQFAVSRDTVLNVSRDRLHHLRNWILHTDLSSLSAGAVFEALWHVVFLGPRNSTLTTTPVQCYCELYGLCMEKQMSQNLAQTVLDGAVIMAGRMLDSLS